MSTGLQFVVITGMSGAGKSQAIDAFEDAGYFCVDNLPPQLVPPLVDLFRLEGSKVDKVAIVSDVRGGEYFGQLEDLLSQLQESGVQFDLVYLEASNEALVRRFKETRRRHPLAGDGSVIDGIRRERQRLAGLRERATLILDTSDLSIHQLKAQLNEDLIQHTRRTNLVFAIVSFGYKYGIPIDADLLFDVRFLPNPYYDLRLRPLTGLDAEVRDYVLGSPGVQEYLDRLVPLLDFLFPRYAAEGKAHLTIGVGCTGGRHRSVTIAEWLGERYEQAGLLHRSCATGTCPGTDATPAPRLAVPRHRRQALAARRRPGRRALPLSALVGFGYVLSPTLLDAWVWAGCAMRCGGYAADRKGWCSAWPASSLRCAASSRFERSTPDSVGEHARAAGWPAGRASSPSAAATVSPRCCAASSDHTSNLTAVVTVADDGGSSGKLRQDMGDPAAWRYPQLPGRARRRRDPS